MPHNKYCYVNKEKHVTINTECHKQLHTEKAMYVSISALPSSVESSGQRTGLSIVFYTCVFSH